MIQLSSLPATSAENPAKLAMFAAPEGVFEAMLGEEAAAGRQESGKVLPVGGKILPDALPVEVAATGLVGPKVAQINAFPIAEAAPKVTDGALKTLQVPAEIENPLLEGEIEPAAADVADAPETAAPAFEIEAGLSPLPIALMLTMVAPENEAEAPAAPMAGSAASLKTVVEPGSTLIAQSDAEEGEGEEAADKPVRQAQAATLASPALLAALGRRGDAVADRAPAPRDGDTEVPAEGAGETELTAPVAQQAPAAAAKPARQTAMRESVLEITREAKTAAVDLSAARSQSATGTMAFQAPAAQALPAEGAATPAPGVRPAFESAAHNNSVRPHDLTALVDRLVEARQNARSTSASLTVMHAEFGEVSVRFGQDNGGLTVSLANNDPGFHRAVNAAVATDSQPNGDAAAQGGRREDGQSSARASAENDRGNGRANGDRRDDAQARTERNNAEQREAALEGRRALGGIFA